MTRGRGATPDFGVVRSKLGLGDIFGRISQDGEPIVGHVARMETLQDDWLQICGATGPPRLELRHDNPTSRGDEGQSCDDEF